MGPGQPRGPPDPQAGTSLTLMGLVPPGTSLAPVLWLRTVGGGQEPQLRASSREHSHLLEPGGRGRAGPGQVLKVVPGKAPDAASPPVGGTCRPFHGIPAGDGSRSSHGCQSGGPLTPGPVPPWAPSRRQWLDQDHSGPRVVSRFEPLDTAWDASVRDFPINEELVLLVDICPTRCRGHPYPTKWLVVHLKPKCTWHPAACFAGSGPPSYRPERPGGTQAARCY